MQGFEDGDVVAILHHVACKAQAGRTRTYDGHLDAVLGSQFGQDDVTALALIVGHEALQVADSHGRFVHLQVDALAFALLLLRADASADGRQRRGVLQHAGGFEELAALHVLDERGDIDTDRTSLHTRRVGAIQATLGFGHGLFLGIACVHLLRTGCGAIDGVEFVHRVAGDGGTFLWLHALAQGLTPGGFAVEELFHRGVGRHGSSCGSRLGRCFLLWRGVADRSFQMAHLFALHFLERSHALEHLVPFHLVAVELRAVHADELRLSAHGDAAGTTHARAVHHDGVQRYVGRNVVFLGQQAAEFHHDGGADGETFVHLLALDDALDAFGHEAFIAIRAVVGHDDDLVRRLPHFIFEDNQVLGAAGQDRNHTVACLFQGLDDGQHRSYTHATTGTYHRTKVLDVCGLSQRTHYVEDIVACVQLAQLGGREAYFLHHQRNGALLYVGSCDGQRHAFALGVHADDDEVACLARAGNERGLYFELEHFLRKLFFANDFVHYL